MAKLTCAPGSSVTVGDLFDYVNNQLKGDKGDRGPTGSAGAKGDRGFTGLRGLIGPDGPVGPRGPNGLEGHKGADGVQGPAGPTGPDGHKGDKGERGTAIHFEGAYDTEAMMIAANPTPEIGEVHLVRFEADGVTVKGDLFVYDNPTPPHDPAGAGWHDVGHVQGPEGPRGLDGHKGDDGLIGPDGPTGADGHKGDDGDPGTTGPAGDSVHVIGTETLAHILASATQTEGDIWITTTAGTDQNTPAQTVAVGDGLIFHNGAWRTFGQFRGLTGANGVKGDEGDEGPKGDPGPTGGAGPAGGDGTSVTILGTNSMNNILTYGSGNPEGSIWISSTDGVDESSPAKHVSPGDGVMMIGGKHINIGQIKGDTGDRGTSIHFEGAYDTLVALKAHNPTPEIGETHLVLFEADGTTSLGDLFVYDNPTPPHDPSGADWHNVGHVQGPDGPQGKPGVPGVPGVPGGPGKDGTDGDPGDDGTNFRFVGTRSLASILAFPKDPSHDGYLWISSTAGNDQDTPSNHVNVGDGITYHNGKYVNVGQIRGDKGPKGDRGTSIHFEGAYNTLADLIAHNPTPEIGETHLVRFEADGTTIKGDLYVYDNPAPPHDPAGADWHDVGHVQGPEGPQGLKGPQGDPGPTHFATHGQVVSSALLDKAINPKEFYYAGQMMHKGSGSATADWNTFKTTGFWEIRTNVSPNAPAQNLFGILSVEHTDNYTEQTFIDSNSNVKYVRVYKQASSAWSAWSTFTNSFATHTEVVASVIEDKAINPKEFNYKDQMMYKGVAAPAVDWDTLRTTGFWDIHKATGNNTPVMNVYGHIVVKAGGGYTQQTFFRNNGANIWTRFASNSTTWSAWVELRNVYASHTEVVAGVIEDKAITPKEFNYPDQMMYKGAAAPAVDWDTLQTTGFWDIHKATGNGKPSTNAYGTVSVLKADGYISQTFIQAGHVLYRYKANAGAWSPWVETASVAWANGKFLPLIGGTIHHPTSTTSIQLDNIANNASYIRGSTVSGATSGWYVGRGKGASDVLYLHSYNSSISYEGTSHNFDNHVHIDTTSSACLYLDNANNNKSFIMGKSVADTNGWFIGRAGATSNDVTMQAYLGEINYKASKHTFDNQVVINKSAVVTKILTAMSDIDCHGDVMGASAHITGQVACQRVLTRGDIKTDTNFIGANAYITNWVKVMSSTAGTEVGFMWNAWGTKLYATNAASIHSSETFKVHGNMTATGTITPGTSDMRLKDKTGVLTNPLDKICSLNAFTYKANDLAIELGYPDKLPHVGLSAQEVQAVLPEVVSLAPIDHHDDMNEDGSNKSKSGKNYLTIDYAKLTPLLIEAVKELTKRVEELEAQL